MAGTITKGRTTEAGQVTYRARYKASDGRWYEKSLHSKAEAQAYLDRQTASIVAQAFVAPKKERTTFAVVAADWSSIHIGDVDPATGVRSATTITPGTATRYEGDLRNHIVPKWGHLPLKMITTVAIQRWVKELMAAGMAPASVKHAHRVMSMVLTHAVEDNLIGRNHAVGVNLPSLPTEEPRILERHEIDALADAAGSESDIIRTLASMGLRMGELAGLKVENVDFEKCNVRIVNNLTEVGGHLHLGSPKSGQARTVPFTQSLSPLLWARCEGKGKGDYVFTAPRGGPLRQRAFRLRFDRACTLAGITDFHPHLLRHTFASSVIQAGGNPKMLQKIMGHSTAAMTARYTHLFRGDLDDLVSRMEAMGAARTPLVAVPSLRPSEPATVDPGARVTGTA